MLTFTQFLTEYKDHSGFLRPGGDAPIKQRKQFGHESLAITHGFKSVPDALKKGLVRFYHHTATSTGTGYREGDRSAGYEFYDTPASRKLVSDHIRHSGGFRHIVMDQRDPSTGELKYDCSNKFTDVESAQKHLDR